MFCSNLELSTPHYSYFSARTETQKIRTQGKKFYRLAVHYGSFPKIGLHVFRNKNLYKTHNLFKSKLYI